MKLEKLVINNFKNNKDSVINPSSRVNIFVGENGAGKTNILEAIYYLSFCKSPFNFIDNHNILHNEAYFMIKGEYIDNDGYLEKVHIKYSTNERKIVKRNGKEYDKLADHIGSFPLVMICPSDSNLIYGGSDERRKYIDGVISQFDKAYLNTLLSYNKILAQRNALLKSMNDKPNMDSSVLEILNIKLADFGLEIYEKRKNFLNEFIPIIQRYYNFISNEKEAAGISYKSQLETDDLENLLKNNIRKDLALRHTSCGIHRDDLEFELNNFPIKKYGSQGQQKSFLIALKIAQFEFTFNKKSFKPILLLDDIFDKLDVKRVEQLMKLVSRHEFGQIFITDTNEERVNKIFSNIKVERKNFMVTEGFVNEI